MLTSRVSRLEPGALRSSTYDPKERGRTVGSHTAIERAEA